MSPRKIVALGVISGVLAGAIALGADAKKEGPVDLALASMEGGKAHLRDLRGKVVVLNMWATWCGPCREEMPMMVEAEKTWGSEGVVFIGASLDDSKTRKNIPGFLKEFGITFPIWTGATSDDLARLHLGEAVPDTAFVDADGVFLLGLWAKCGDRNWMSGWSG
jgi:thiol-disulfide isomerase/thioredoxin